jgi:hypothetical protein
MVTKARRRGAAKEIVVDGVKYKSLLEGAAAALLKEAGLEFKYEPTKYVLLEGFKGQNFCVEEDKLSLTNIQVTYTPDFVGPYWIMETKGMKTPDFMIKWKFFKQKLEEEGNEKLLFMPRNKKQIIAVIAMLQKLRIAQEAFMMVDGRIAFINAQIEQGYLKDQEPINPRYSKLGEKTALLDKWSKEDQKLHETYEFLIIEHFNLDRIYELEKLIVMT